MQNNPFLSIIRVDRGLETNPFFSTIRADGAVNLDNLCEPSETFLITKKGASNERHSIFGK